MRRTPTRDQTLGARVRRDQGVGEARAEDDSDRLKDRQGRQKPTAVVGQAFQTDGGVDGDVAADAEAGQGSEEQDQGVRTRETETEAKDAGDEDGVVEGGGPADDVDQQTPDECADGQAEGKRSEDVAQLRVVEAKLVLHRRHHQPKRLCPQQIQQIPKPAQPKHHPLVPAHPLPVQLSVHHGRFLLVNGQLCQALQERCLWMGGGVHVCIDNAAVAVAAGIVVAAPSARRRVQCLVYL